MIVKNSRYLAYVLVVLLAACSTPDLPSPPGDNGDNNGETPVVDSDPIVEGVDYFLPHIDLNNWKVTLPIDNAKEVKPPDILEYGKSTLLKDFMYNDSIDGSLVFYTFPDSSTPNSSYSRTELREQMVPGSNNTNWTFGQGGRMKGTLKMDDISKDSSGDFHRAIIMQIHGRLTDAQREAIGEDDNNAPPILKIYWNDNRVRVLRKTLKDVNVSDIDILKTDAWTDEGKWFEEVVGNDKFTLEIIAEGSLLKIILNENEEMVFDDIHTEKWAVFENYFKAGNYLITGDKEAYSKIKYYKLAVSH